MKSWIERDILCTGCGTCAGICPDNIVEMRKNSGGTYTPILKDTSCKECGLCVKVCPGISVNFIELNKRILGKAPKNVFVGSYINCYVGHSTDERVLYESASGGIATALLIFALEEGLIDGAIVTKMDAKNPLEPKVFIARTRDEIISASKSKYCPVPLNVSLKHVLTHNDRLAIVGLPCHMHGLRKAELHKRELKDRIILRIGLFCGHTVNFSGTKFLLDRMGIKVKDVVKLDYRSRGWPGGMTIKLRDGSEKFLPQPFYWGCFFAPFFFTPIRCTLCSDQTNELADISLGDAFLPELMKNNKGESIIITRTKVGEKILRKAKQKGKIMVTRVDSNEVIRSQRSSLYFKKKGLMARMSIMKILGKKVPKIRSKLLRTRDPTIYVGAMLTYLNIYISSRNRLQRILMYVPLPILRLYSNIVIRASIGASIRGNE